MFLLFVIKKYFNFYLKMYSRSGLSFKQGIEVGAGVVDKTFCGEIKINLFNHSNDSFHIKKGDRIGQGVVYMIPNFTVETITEVPHNESRGNKGFGSSGK
jgi:dUTP pyrophosphatase